VLKSKKLKALFTTVGFELVVYLPENIGPMESGWAIKTVLAPNRASPHRNNKYPL
jgi:hypothetical protein